jgi:uncharacterized protein (DUF4415 family)
MTPNVVPMQGTLRVVPPAVLDAAEKKAAEEKAALVDAQNKPNLDNLAGFIRAQFDMMKAHRNSGSGWSDRLLAAQRDFKGEYDPGKLQQIKAFGGSEIYARIVAAKCRGASSLLRDVYLGADRPWAIDPPADPDVPPEIEQSIQKLIEVELGTLQQSGQPIDPGAVRDRASQLIIAAREAAKKKAKIQAKISEEKIDELLINGGFYRALSEFLVDLPQYPFACIKGPVVKVVPTVNWVNGKATVEQKPKMTWVRVSPFDLWFTPSAGSVESAEFIERLYFTRSDLNDLLDLPGYNHDAVRSVLDEYGRGGIADNWDSTDAERAVMENRENPFFNRSGMLTCLEYHGCVQGRMLLEYGLPKEQVPDELRDYMVQAWLIGRYLIKVQLAPSPRKRSPYFLTSYEKLPGTLVGNGLPDLLNDIQEVCNASLRSLVNNLSIASGPQVVVNDDRLQPGVDADSLYPWKRWHVQNDPLGSNSQAPVSFFQPVSNASELMAVYQAFVGIADEISGIPRYLTGSGTTGGAGRTASGLAMLLQNSSKLLQTVAANIDHDVIDPALTQLADMIMLTDTSGLLTGQEAIRVKGVDVATQRETQRARQLEFLTATANPIDVSIIGAKGRAAVLRAVSNNLGLDGQEIVPREEEIAAQVAQTKAMQLTPDAAKAQGDKPGQETTGDMGPRTNVAQPRISGGVQ